MNRSLRILLFAHHQMGVAVFQGLREAGHEIATCFTHPTKSHWIPSVSGACHAVGAACSESDPQPSEAHPFRESRPDLIVCAGYRHRVSLPFLALPRWGAINVHPAPLPHYRGASPIPWGILDGQTTWAVSIHAMTHNYNEGGILRERTVPLYDADNAFDLLQRCGEIGAREMIQAVNDIATAGGAGKPIPQDLRGVQFFDSALPFGGRIDWNQPAIRLAAFVRAMDLGRGDADGTYEHLAPPAQAILHGNKIGLWRARAGGTMSPFPPGTITRCDSEVWVQTGRGHLVLERLCDATGRDFSAADHLHTLGIEAGQRFDAHHLWRIDRPTGLSSAA